MQEKNHLEMRRFQRLTFFCQFPVRTIFIPGLQCMLPFFVRLSTIQGISKYSNNKNNDTTLSDGHNIGPNAIRLTIYQSHIHMIMSFARLFKNHNYECFVINVLRIIPYKKLGKMNCAFMFDVNILKTFTIYIFVIKIITIHQTPSDVNVDVSK